jgi:hypothetical protein
VTALNASRGEAGHRWPQFLPDGRHFLYLAIGGDPELSGIDVGTLESEQGRRLMQASSEGLPLQTDGHGYLLYRRGEVLNGRPFDLNSANITGEAFVVADRVRFDPLTRYTLASGSAYSHTSPVRRSTRN